MEEKQNIAILDEEKVVDHSDCEECNEEYYFLMKDNYHEFSLGLSTILNCVSLLEKEGLVPPLPTEWWMKVMNRY